MASKFKKGVSQVLTINRATTGFGPPTAETPANATAASSDGQASRSEGGSQAGAERTMAQSLWSELNSIVPATQYGHRANPLPFRYFDSSSAEEYQPITSALRVDTVDRVRLRMKVTAMFGGDSRKEQSSDAQADVREKEFHAMFHAKQNEKEELLLSSEEQEENMWDVVDLDDEAIEEYASNELLGQFLSNTVFRSGILAVILINSLLIAVETDQGLERKYSHLFSVLDQCLMTIFVCEILVKWYHGFFMFWRMGWNVLDFFIVVALLLGPLISTGSGSRGVLRILRVLRAFRSLRSISSLPGLQIVVQTILQSVPDMANIVLLLVIIMLVFSVIGITLFRDVVPLYFGNLSSAMLTLFVCLTQDGWMEIFRSFKEMGETYYIAGGFYLFVFIAIGAFVFANLVVAVVVTNLEFAMDHVKSEEKEREADDLKSKTELSDDTVPTVSVDDVAPGVYHRQMPFQIPEFKSICTERLENYLLILSAIEDNLVEYKKLKGELIEIFSEVCDMQEKARKEGILKPEADLSAIKTDQRVALTGGDLMSNLIELEKGRMIDSKRHSLDMLLKEGARNVANAKRSSQSERRKSSFFSGRR